MNKRAFLAKWNTYYQRLGIPNKPAIWEDGMRSTGGEGTYEWWYFDADYTDGTNVAVSFYTKNRFDVIGPENPTATIHITLPSGKTITKCISEGEEQKIRASRRQCHVQICESSIKYSEGDYLIHFVADDIEYTCTMKSKLPMWRPATGHWYYGEKQEYYFAWLVPQPSADVSATLKVKGETFELKGSGYHDHSWGNVDVSKIMNHWYCLHANIGPYTILACDILTEKDYDYKRLPVLMLAKDGIILDNNDENTVVKDSNKEYHRKTKKFIDNNLTFIYEVDDDTNYEIEFTRKQDISTTSLLDVQGINPIKKIAARIRGINPTYMKCLTEVKLTINSGDTQEILEKEGLWKQIFFNSNKDIIEVDRNNS
jgi:hypothetical protein